MRFSRAWDLYLALENAYEDNGEDLSLLLSQIDKKFRNDQIHDAIKTMYNHTQGEIQILGVPVAARLDIVQAGNWPLISYVSMATALLGLNTNDPNSTSVNSYSFVHTKADELLTLSRRAMSLGYWDSSEKRLNYWFYQTGGGQAFWAEGPHYLDLALPNVLEFLHAYRANNGEAVRYALGTAIADPLALNTSDPFYDSKFTNALDWIYHLATPQGFTPPLDDGNKSIMACAGLLSWSGSYGDDIIGKKFAHIRDIPKVKSNLQFESRLVEIAFEHQATGSGIDHPEYYGNISSTNHSKHQTVIRKQDANGTQHYILMNGERGEAITAGV